MRIVWANQAGAGRLNKQKGRVAMSAGNGGRAEFLDGFGWGWETSNIGGAGQQVQELSLLRQKDKDKRGHCKEQSG